jgi:hypothetical protein
MKTLCAPIFWRCASTIFLKRQSVNTKVEDDARKLMRRKIRTIWSRFQNAMMYHGRTAPSM